MFGRRPKDGYGTLTCNAVIDKGTPDGIHKGNIDTGTNRVDPCNPPPEECPLPKLVEFQR